MTWGLVLVCGLGGVSVWSDVDGLGSVGWEYVGRVCGVMGHGQTLEWGATDGLPLSWVVKLMVVVGWSVCVVGCGGFWDCVCDTGFNHFSWRGILMHAYWLILGVWE